MTDEIKKIRPDFTGYSETTDEKLTFFGVLNRFYIYDIEGTKSRVTCCIRLSPAPRNGSFFTVTLRLWMWLCKRISPSASPCWFPRPVCFWNARDYECSS